MGNPNNAVGTNAAYDGRTSVKAFNDGIGAYSRGVLSGWACAPNTGLTVSLGGDGNTRDIAIAEDAAGNKTTINNISEAPVNVTLSAAPASNSRIDSIVAYVDNPPQGSATSIDNPAACGIIAVDGTAAANPTAPNESAIRTAITADGASGATAYYVVLANVTIASGTTDITIGDIEAGSAAQITLNNIDFSAFSFETSQITLTFKTGSTITGTGNATLIKLDNNIGVLLYTGSTGWSDAATGTRELVVNFDAGFQSILGNSVNSYYGGMPAAYQAYTFVTKNSIDNYVIKPDAAQQTRMINFVIFGSFI